MFCFLMKNGGKEKKHTHANTVLIYYPSDMGSGTAASVFGNDPSFVL